MADVLTEKDVSATRRMASVSGCGVCQSIFPLTDSHEQLRARLESAEQEARIWTGPHATCRICGACADRPFGQVSVAIPHRPTCPFAALGAARRERNHLRDLLREALSLPTHGKGCPELRDAGPCECWIARAREALKKAKGENSGTCGD